MASNFISYRFLSLRYAQPMNWNRFDLCHIPYNMNWINFDLHHIARNYIQNIFDLRYMVCNMSWINFDSYYIARNPIRDNSDLRYMICNMRWINFDSHYIARHLVSNKLDLLRISCNLIRNTIWPTNISRSKTSRRTGADRKHDSMWGRGMGIIKQRLILPAFWWCSDRRPPRCMKRESGESPEQCPLL